MRPQNELRPPVGRATGADAAGEATTTPNCTSKSAQTWLAKYLEELAATIDDGPALTISLRTGRDVWRLPANLRVAAVRRRTAGDRLDLLAGDLDSHLTRLATAPTLGALRRTVDATRKVNAT
jgi:hypothetical protein